MTTHKNDKMILNPLTKLRNFYILNKHPIKNSLWKSVISKLTVIKSLQTKELRQLKKLTTLLLYNKNFVGVQGLELSEEHKLIIATQACLPILKLDISYYDGWHDVVVYPDTFIVYRDTTDSNGLVHSNRSTLSGEAWSRGPVILSWSDVQLDSFELREGHNVVIHEFSHKLDMLNGRANGMPPLHPTMHRQEWTDSLSKAYDRLKNKYERHQHAHINEYATTNPAEYFAVTSEYFFTAPAILKKHSPEVYSQLMLFYKQDPLDIKFE